MSEGDCYTDKRCPLCGEWMYVQRNGSCVPCAIGLDALKRPRREQPRTFYLPDGSEVVDVEVQP